jgi:hypothetical protein
MNRKLVLALAAVAIALATGAVAEDQAEMGLRYAEAHQQSLNLMKQYTWQIDSTLSQDGQLKVHVLSDCRVNEKGELVQEVETAETTVRRKRGLRGRAQASHAEEVGAFLEHVLAVTTSYVYRSKGEEVDFFEKATLTEGSGDEAGTLMATAADVSVPGDKVTKWMDAKTLIPTKVTFEATVDEVPVSGEILYRPIEDGPNVPRMATIQIPSEKGLVEAEFLKYTKQL